LYIICDGSPVGCNSDCGFTTVVLQGQQIYWKINEYKLHIIITTFIPNIIIILCHTSLYYINLSDACDCRKYGVIQIQIKYNVTVTLSETVGPLTGLITRVNNVTSIYFITIYNGRFSQLGSAIRNRNNRYLVSIITIIWKENLT